MMMESGQAKIFEEPADSFARSEPAIVYRESHDDAEKDIGVIGAVNTHYVEAVFPIFVRRNFDVIGPEWNEVLKFAHESGVFADLEDPAEDLYRIEDHA